MLSYHEIKNWFRNALIPCLFALIIVVATVSPAYSQGNTSALNQQTGAPVILGNETLFYIQAGIDSFPPEFRAQVVSTRITSFAKNTEVGLDTLQIILNEAAATVDIQAGEKLLVTIADVDAVSAGQSLQGLANQYLQTIKDSVTQYRISYSIQRLLQGVIYTLIATIVLVASLVVVKKSAIYRQLLRWHETRIPALRLFGSEILSKHRVIDLISEIVIFIRVALVLGLLYLYINLVLSFFPWTKGFARILSGYIWTAIDTLGNGLIAYLPNLFFLSIIWLLTSYSLKVIRFVFTEIEQGYITVRGFYREWAKPTYKLVQYLVLAFAATVAFPYLPGSQTPAFQAISVFLGLLISFGSSSAIANIFAGIILTYIRAFMIGDRVKITDTVGDVVEKTLFVTRIRTIKGVVITIPNSIVLGSHVDNYSTGASDPDSPPLTLHTTVTLGYDVPWRQVYAALTEAALATSEILKDPAPFVLQTSLNDFYVSYELNAFTRNPGMMAKVYSELHENIQDKCNEAQIEILSPHYRAVRDGNQTTIPMDYLHPDYKAPGFRVEQE
ncbi:hypothetical protein BST81_09420 [Leptolyngbya sp. 'hensonii']|uniref:mechanosensitive ion channel family protein n=1 Tax=Leptolyngbya sp. 'hensonii' TaxID=1922337 RepID=UPI00094FE027|nr:mechanosensitive ion channel domain-containing protein [Leptolyngbya sp. 'hensonii']OLP18678.1 hypothetical protein BST81_09420 [Leptolyngbya sp. 'hensonii']